MKHVLIIIGLAMASCASRAPGLQVITEPGPPVASALVAPPATGPCPADSLRLVVQDLRLQLAGARIATDTLAARLLHARLVISNVKFYLNICLRKPSQDKFLKGWIRRAVAD